MLANGSPIPVGKVTDTLVVRVLLTAFLLVAVCARCSLIELVGLLKYLGRVAVDYVRECEGVCVCCGHFCIFDRASSVSLGAIGFVGSMLQGWVITDFLKEENYGLNMTKSQIK